MIARIAAITDDRRAFLNTVRRSRERHVATGSGPADGDRRDTVAIRRSRLDEVVAKRRYLRRFNPAFEVFGYSPEELLSRPWIEFAHPDDRERMLQVTASLEHGANVVELENRVICRDGSFRWVEWSTRVVREEGLFFAAGRDVTEGRRAAEEQAALRRVATLVARETAPDEVFAAVAREVGAVLGVDAAHLGRYDGDGTVVSVAQWGSHPGVAIGTRFPLEDDSVSVQVLRTGRPARMDDYEHASGVIAATIRRMGVRSAIGVPISVEGRTWGVMTATSKGAPFPAETESRLQGFPELVATAIANAEARAQVARLAAEQVALRRVATLVAHGASPSAVFDAVTREVAELLDASAVTLARFSDDELDVVSTRGASYVKVGDRYPIGGLNVTSNVLRTGRTGRLDDYSDASGQIGEYARATGVRSVVAAPVVVDGRTWGVLAAIWADRGPPPDDTQERLAGFAECSTPPSPTRTAGTSSPHLGRACSRPATRRAGAWCGICTTAPSSGSCTRSSRSSSRSRRSTRAAATRRSGSPRRWPPRSGRRPRCASSRAASCPRSSLTAGCALGWTRSCPHWISSSISTSWASGYLRREASAYFIVAEALTNVVKHARATRATVRAAADEGVLSVEVRDDGVGGANPDGHGLVGIADRVDALGGQLRIESPEGGGTMLAAWLPLASRWPREPEADPRVPS